MVLEMQSATRASFLSGLNTCMGHVTSVSIFPLGLCINKWLKDTGTQEPRLRCPCSLTCMHVGIWGGGRHSQMCCDGTPRGRDLSLPSGNNPLRDTSSIDRDCKACESPTETGTPHPSIPIAQGAAGHVSACRASGGSRQIFGLGSVLGDGQHSP